MVNGSVCKTDDREFDSLPSLQLINLGGRFSFFVIQCCEATFIRIDECPRCKTSFGFLSQKRKFLTQLMRG